MAAEFNYALEVVGTDCAEVAPKNLPVLRKLEISINQHRFARVKNPQDSLVIFIKTLRLSLT